MTREESSADRSREIRLGLVMYGGVSLAIYIYGVAQEFFNAVRGRGVFKLIKALTDSDIVVDVISGTSAGGINGILLSYCLANDLEISAAASTWRDQGGIAAMLRDPLRDPTPPSVLQGDAYFLKELEKAFERLKSFKLTPENAPDDDPSEIRELDLFVTGTDVDGRVTTRFDALGNPIDVKDHRVVFHLKHRAHRKEQFKPGRIGDDSDITCKALGKLARITSSFPAAFEPVQIGGKAASESLDGQLGYWGWGRGGTERNVFLADGGILDNKPFTPTIREIFHRTSEREVERWLFYVEPDPERFQKQPEVVEPNVFKIVLGSLSSIPSYESIADDLSRLDEHNEKVKRFRRLVDYTRVGDGLGLDKDSFAFVERWRSWEAGKPAPVEALPTDSVPANQRPSPYAQSRLVEISERVVQGVLRIEGRNAQLSEDQRQAAEALLKAYDQWPGNGDFTLYNFDIAFRMRRLFHVLYTCPKPQLGGDGERLGPTRYALNRQLKLLEIIRAALERLLDLGDFGWTPAGDSPARGTQAPEGWDVNLWRYQVANAFVFLLHSADILPEGYDKSWETGWPRDEEWLSQSQLEDVRKKLEHRVADALKYLASGEIDKKRPERQAFANILMATDACERRMLGRIGHQRSRPLTAPNGVPIPKVERVLGNEYEDFVRVDAVLFPLQAFSGLHERDIIKTVRVSPLEARRAFSGRPLAEKVSGDSLAHFGGFLKKSWRSNDILWGRLDAVCQLTETLLTRARVVDVVNNQGTREALRELKVSALFPQSPARTCNDLQSWVSSLASDDESVRRDALEEGRFGEMVELLIEAQQLEVLSKEVPTVINDAVAEQMEWNQFRVPRHEAESLRYDPGTQTFYRHGGGDLDPLVVTAASMELAKKMANDLKEKTADGPGVARPRDTALGRFFISKYKVGAEELDRDIPIVVLLQVLSTTLLVTRNCLLAALDKTRSDAVKRNWLYRIFSGILWSFDGAVALMRRGELQVITIVTVLALFAGAAFYVGASWWSAIISPNGGFALFPFLVFIVVPFFILTAEVWLLSSTAWQARAGSDDKSRFEKCHPLGRVAPSRMTPLLVVLLVLTVVTGALSYGEPHWQTHVIDSASSGSDDVAHRWKSIAWDSVFLVMYTGLLSLAGLTLARRLRRRHSVIAPFGILFAWLALAAGAIDLIENLVVAVVLWMGTVPEDSVARPLLALGSHCSHFKFVLPGIVVLGLALMTIPLGVKWLRRR